MDIAKLISHLRRELVLVDQAIASLEPLVPSTKRRGRPRKRLPLYTQLPGVPDPLPGNPRRRASVTRNTAASAGGKAQEPEPEGKGPGGETDSES
jgi:hypothetical protein